MQDDMRGIFWLKKQQKFMVRVQSSGVRYTVGYFKTVPEARMRRNAFIQELTTVPRPPEPYSHDWFRQRAAGQVLQFTRHYLNPNQHLTRDHIGGGITIKVNI